MLRRGFLAAFDDEQGALSLHHRITSSPLTPTLLEILSPDASRILLAPDSKPGALQVGSGSWHVCVGYEGSSELCGRYGRELSRIAQEASAHDHLLIGELQFALLAEQLREAIPLLMQTSPLPVVFRFRGLLAELAALIRALRSFVASSWIPSAMLLGSHGVLHLALLPAAPEESVLKQAAYFWKSVESLRGKLDFHASIQFCPAEWKRELNVWGTAQPDLPLMRRVKSAFDPQNILAPGRFVGGI